MRIITVFALALITVFAAVFLFGCAQKSKSYGQPITKSEITPIGNILANPEQFVGKAVKVAGKIAEECPVGGWFFLTDQTGNIYVNLHPNYFAIPQIQGHQVVAQGVVKKEYNQISIIGEGVELK